MNKYSCKDFKITDSHTHIYPKKIAKKATTAIGDFYNLPMSGIGSSENLIKSGAVIGVSKYLVCGAATVHEQVRSVNDFITEECNKYPEFIGFGTLHPSLPNMDSEVSRLKGLGLKGIKIHPDFQKFDIDSPEAFKIYAQIEDSLPILIHMGDNRYDYSRPIKLVKVLENFPRLNIIAAHFGGYMCWDEARSCLKHPNIKFDTSSSLTMISPDYARDLISYYGAENFFFGTDFPMWAHDEELNRFFSLNLSYEDNKKILSDNFLEYFK